MKKELISYIPGVLLDTYEFPLLCLAEQPEFNRFYEASDEVLDSQFIETAPEKAIARYEEIFGIIAKDTESIEERRLRLLERINERLPYTIRRLQSMLDSVYGEGVCSVSMDYANYALTVSVDVSQRNSLNEELFKRVVPANILLTLSMELPAMRLYEGFFTHELTHHTYSMTSQPDMSVREGRIYGGFAVRESALYRYEMRGD